MKIWRREAVTHLLSNKIFVCICRGFVVIHADIGLALHSWTTQRNARRNACHPGCLSHDDNLTEECCDLMIKPIPSRERYSVHICLESVHVLLCLRGCVLDREIEIDR